MRSRLRSNRTRRGADRSGDHAAADPAGLGRDLRVRPRLPDLAGADQRRARGRARRGDRRHHRRGGPQRRAALHDQSAAWHNGRPRTIDVNRNVAARRRHRLAGHGQLSVPVHGARTRSCGWSSDVIQPGAPLTMSAVARHAKRIARGPPCATESSPSSPSPFSPAAGSRTAPTTSIQHQPVQDRRRADAAGRRRGRRPRARRRAEERRPARSSTSRPARRPRARSRTPDEIVGRGLIVPMVKNEPILPAKLASKEAGAGLPPVIPEGMRAVSVRVNEVIGVAGYVLPGTRVDVVATASPTTNQPQDMTSKVILTNVQVLTAGTRIEQDQEKGKPMQVTVVTLLVYSGAGRAPGARQHRRQDSARAAQPARPGRARDARHQAGGLLGVAKGVVPAARRATDDARPARCAGPVTQEAPVAAAGADGGNHPRRQARRRKSSSRAHQWHAHSRPGRQSR